jgi:hypothetical protein
MVYNRVIGRATLNRYAADCANRPSLLTTLSRSHSLHLLHSGGCGSAANITYKPRQAKAHTVASAHSHHSVLHSGSGSITWQEKTWYTIE